MRKEVKRVARPSLPLYPIVSRLLSLALRCGVTSTGLPDGLFSLLVLGKGLSEPRKGVPLVRTYPGGSAVCVLGGAVIGISGLLPRGNTEILDRLVESGGFLIFHIAVLITESLSQVGRWLLLRTFLRVLPTALADIAAGAAVVMLFNFLQDPSVTESLLYIVIPITPSGVAADTTLLSAIYAEASGIPTGEVSARTTPTTVLGNIVSILFSAFTMWLSACLLKLNGNGQLLRGEGTIQKKSMSQANFGSLLAGPLLSLAFYTAGALLHGFIPAPPAYTGMIFCVVTTKGFSVLSGEMEEVAVIWGQFAIRAFTTAALTGMDVVLFGLNRLASVPTLSYLLTIILSILVIMLAAGFVDSRLMGFYPLEASTTASVCTTDMGGSGNVAMLLAASCMLLLPFARIATRSIGALMSTLGGIFVTTLLH